MVTPLSTEHNLEIAMYFERCHEICWLWLCSPYAHRGKMAIWAASSIASRLRYEYEPILVPRNCGAWQRSFGQGIWALMYLGADAAMQERWKKGLCIKRQKENLGFTKVVEVKNSKKKEDVSTPVWFEHTVTMLVIFGRFVLRSAYRPRRECLSCEFHSRASRCCQRSFDGRFTRMHTALTWEG